MTLSKTLKAFALITLLFFSFNSLALAGDAKLTYLRINNTRDHLLVYLNIDGAFQEKIEEAILAGVPATFTYYIKLHQIRDLWFDKEISNVKAIHTIRYDNLKNEFYIHRSWKNTASIVTKSLTEAKLLMSQINSLEISDVSKLTKGHQYQILAKAELSKVTLPFYLHYVLFFVSMWDFETDWYSTSFIF